MPLWWEDTVPLDEAIFADDVVWFHAAVDKPLVVQFTVKHEEKEYAFCGGGYIKLLPLVPATMPPSSRAIDTSRRPSPPPQLLRPDHKEGP